MANVVQTIEIGCAPGMVRPDDYIKGVMEGSGVDYDGREPVSKRFGDWEWDFSDIDTKVWKAAQPVFKERLTALHASGQIRYASW